MQRISVVGPTGSGKTTMARRLGEALAVPMMEMDSVHWGPDWTPGDRDDIRRRVVELVSRDAWVIDGNYQSISQDLVWAAADMVVWLDYPFLVNAWRLLRRTGRRIFGREELWGGNRETLRKALLSRDSILWWLVKTHRKVRERYLAAMASDDLAHLRFVRLRSPREADRWAASLG